MIGGAKSTSRTVLDRVDLNDIGNFSSDRTAMETQLYSEEKYCVVLQEKLPAS